MSEQPANIRRAEPIDEIRALLGDIPDDEFEQRRRLRLCRTIASHKVAATRCPMARQLLWMVCDTATANLFATLPIGVLTDVAAFCRALLDVAEHAERLEAADGR